MPLERPGSDTLRILHFGERADQTALASDPARFALEPVSGLQELAERVLADAPDLVTFELEAEGGWEHQLEALRRFHEDFEDQPVLALVFGGDDRHRGEAIAQGASNALIAPEDTANGFWMLQTARSCVAEHGLSRDLKRVNDQLVQVSRFLERSAVTDPLTGLLNRRGLRNSLARELKRASRHGEGLEVLLIDLDDFHDVNQKLGFAAGDVVLAEIGRRLRETLRETDTIARVGGDDFLVLLQGVRPAEGVQVAEKLQGALKGCPIVTSSRTVRVTASMGMATVPDYTLGIDEILHLAQAQLRRSRREGKQRVCHSGNHSALNGHGEEGQRQKRDTISRLHAGEGIRSLAQPIIRLADHAPAGYEMLARFDHDELASPDRFFLLSQEAELLTSVDLHCFRAGLAGSQELSDAGRVNLNLFPSTILDVSAERLVDMLPDRKGVTYCIEISEQQVIGDPSYLIESVKAFQEAGILVAIDDVGFGRSCLESLILLEPDVVKIDKRLVTGTAEHPDRARALNRLLRVSEALGAVSVAEGIESKTDLCTARNMGVQFGQGFLLGAPIELKTVLPVD